MDNLAAVLTLVPTAPIHFDFIQIWIFRWTISLKRVSNDNSSKAEKNFF